ncbi:MAG: hypothetical protein H6727_07010 [Myxococcales bacterium]|nr:hypothetical protein [Myxococcales bacterium]
MRKNLVALIGFLLSFAALPAVSHASSMAGCSVEARVLGVRGAWKDYGKKYPRRGVPVRLHILRIIGEYGHVNDYCERQGIVGTGPNVLLLTDEKQAELVKKGAAIQAAYHHSSGFSGKRMFVHSSWKFVKLLSKVTPSKKIDLQGSRAALKALIDKVEGMSKKGLPYEIVLTESDPTKGFRISCPLGVRCDAGFGYHAQWYNKKGQYLYLSFDSRLLAEKEINLDALKKNFSYISFTSKIQLFESEGWFVEGNKLHSQVLRQKALGKQIKLTGYKDGRLQGELLITLPSLYATFRLLPCAPLPAGGKLPASCQVSSKHPLLVKVRFDLPFKPAALDCQKRPRDKGC